MGQGTDSCGGWELEYDPVEEGLADGTWVSGDNVSNMSVGHLRNAIHHAQQSARAANFSCNEDNWNEWVDILETELARRQDQRTATKVKVKVANKEKVAVRGAKVKMKCHCGNEYNAREADLKRGWALSCSKSCAATRRDFGRSKATRITE